ncbi:helix-turn-helix domain-containing protein [Desulforudis sp. DRI-14]|uniref:helix-turn-helix domain-containing protein n=1 Tax=Desulforudis sp. DRI-14 TaxID=3459793 RepID=UPI004041CF63
MVRRARKSKGLSQAALARAVGLTPQYISDIERRRAFGFYHTLQPVVHATRTLWTDCSRQIGARQTGTGVCRMVTVKGGTAATVKHPALMPGAARPLVFQRPPRAVFTQGPARANIAMG